MMAQVALKQPNLPPQRPQLRVHRGFGGGPPSGPTVPAVGSPELAVLIFIVFELMLFSGLVATYLVLRTSSFAWPPPGLPRLPVAVTAVNTVILTFSAVTMYRATREIAAGAQGRFRNALLVTVVLGTTFLVVQGSEWVQLIHRGLTLTSGSYGGIFYTLIGLHALHVVGAVVWLGVVLVAALRRRYTPQRYTGVRLCAMYWYFVVGLWPLLFVLVYVY
jgi:heme/copper-type cytochrome/quinol oxidase subunit 3